MNGFPLIELLCGVEYVSLVHSLAIILSGLPGSGKTSLARMIQPDREFRMAADDYFTDADGRYTFDPSKIGDAHGYCLRQFIRRCQERHAGPVVVHNTGSSVAELAPYVAVASAYGRTPLVLRVECNMETALSRQTHNVPRSAVVDMRAAWLSECRPMWWKVLTVTEEAADRAFAVYLDGLDHGTTWKARDGFGAVRASLWYAEGLWRAEGNDGFMCEMTYSTTPLKQSERLSEVWPHFMREVQRRGLVVQEGWNEQKRT